MFYNRLGMNRRTTIAIGLVSAAGLAALAGCSPSSSPSPTPTQSSASPTNNSSTITTYKLYSGGTATVAGDATQYTTSGGAMTVDSATGSGTGVLAATINVAAISNTPNQPSGWELRLVTNGEGVVQSGSLISPGSQYKVSQPSGKINFLTTGSGTTLTTTTPIKVQRGTETPTTLTVNIPGTK